MSERKFLPGTLDVLVLKTLSWGPMHGYGIAMWLEETAGEVLHLEEGSLYPALYRMERRRWIRSEWRRTENNRRAKYYALTEAGTKQLRAEVGDWARFAEAMGKVLNASPPAWARGR